MTSDGDDLRTIGEVAELLGVSVRTLHHWEERGLVAPAERSWSNYRLYSDADIARLQQIMIYRATGMNLEAIANLLESGGDPVAHLRHQRDLLIEKEDELRRMVEAVDELLEGAMSEKHLSVDEVAKILGQADFPAYQAEAEQTWGDTDDWKISQRTTAAMTASDWEALRDRSNQVETKLAEAMAAGVTPGSEEADALAEEHRALLSAYYPVSYSKHVLIARGYVADPRFRQYYDQRGVGLAEWLKNIIDANAAGNGVDPTTAQWE